MQQAIKISVTTKYLGIREQSENEDVYVFSYTVDIHNVSEQSLQLMSRYWLITNGDGEKVEIHGDGVVGEQPVIAPNETFSYTSASMLKTSVGTMEGFYYFSDNTESEVKIPIPVFSLVVPNSLH